MEQGSDLANKLWNASRLILLNAAEVEPAPRTARLEDRWLLSRLEKTIASVTEKLEAYDFAHAVQECYGFVYGDLCDWYLEIVKPRLYEGEEDVSATLLYALERVLALLHPTMPFVTEELWSFHPARDGHLVVHAFPTADTSLYDEVAEEEVAEAIALTRSLRAWRDLVGVPAKAVLPAVLDGMAPSEFVGRLSRFAFDGVGSDPVASVGPVRVLASDELDAEAVEERLGKRREELESEIQRAERKLGNQGFVAKAPPIVVEEERGKLERYKKELAELEGS
jgi:valyl-tRNA synthetase